MATTTDLEFFFDPICPFDWVTSRWVVEVSELRGVTIEWKFIALAIVNEETDYSKFPPAYPALHGLGRRLLRVAAAARAAGGNEAVGAFYTATGDRMHHDGVSVAVFEVVAAAGLDASLAAAADDESWDELLREETDQSLGRTGRDVGTPILTFAPGTDREASLFGPVISSIPRGDAALELWDAVQTLARTPGFAELKRSMRDPLSFD
jgi:2-hydroxychromene-2-carboxylate isomerase